MNDIAALIGRIDAQPPLVHDRTLLADIRAELSRLTVSPLPGEIASAMAGLAVIRDSTVRPELRDYASAAVSVLSDLGRRASALQGDRDDLLRRVLALESASVSPRPEEIAGLCDWLRLLVNQQAYDAAAALRRLAEEVERLETKQTAASDVIRHYKERAHGAERELGIVRARIAELEADVEARIAENNQLHESIGAVRAEYLQRYMNATDRITELEAGETSEAIVERAAAAAYHEYWSAVQGGSELTVAEAWARINKHTRDTWIRSTRAALEAAKGKAL